MSDDLTPPAEPARWELPNGGRGAYLTVALCALLALGGLAMFIDSDYPELRRASRIELVAVTSMIILAIASLVRQTLAAWFLLVLIDASRMVRELAINQSDVVSAWIGFALVGVIPLAALWRVRPVRKWRRP